MSSRIFTITLKTPVEAKTLGLKSCELAGK